MIEDLGCFACCHDAASLYGGQVVWQDSARISVFSVHMMSARDKQAKDLEPKTGLELLATVVQTRWYGFFLSLASLKFS